ncbi:hypothetical protein JCM10207_002964 [Rhodosporidiobolus poonsookiae]
MDGNDDGSGAFGHPRQPSGSLPQPPPNRQLPPQPLTVYTPYNPFLHAASSNTFSTSNAGVSHSFALPGSSAPLDANVDPLIPSPTSSRGTSAPDLAALTALYGTGLTGGSGLAGGDMRMLEGTSPDASTSAQQPKVTQKADRSCKTCRQRRVRCGREFPTCARCKKRRDECNYGEGVYVEETVEGSDQHKIAELEAKISTLELQLRSANASTSRPPTAASPAPSAGYSRSTLPTAISQSVTDLLTSHESTVLSTFLAEDRAGRPSFGNVDNRLASSSIADMVTCYLLDASLRACDAKLPPFAGLTARIPYFKGHLRDLDAAGQVAVAVLAAFGARSCAYPSLFGVSTVTLSDGTPSPPLFLSVGSRRETVCRAIEARARETAWAAGLLRPSSADELEALSALAMLSLHEENDPEVTRFYVRQAVGAFIDVRHGELTRGLASPSIRNVAIAIFMADSLASARTGKPNLISPVELTDYFASAGLDIPDLVNSRLAESVEEQLQSGTLTWPSVSALLTSLFVHVVSCYRVFAQVTTPRRPASSSVLGFVRNLWSVLDQIHGAIQRVQQQLVSLTGPLAGAGDDPHVIDHAILLAVRADDTLVSLVMHVHSYLTIRRDEAPYWTEREGDAELERVRAESMMRVYKCLKLLAFYCQLHCNSQDKHNVFHLLLRLNSLPSWTTLAAMRIGEPGGPITDEFELSEEEGDWFRQALELSLFYSPRTSMTLQALNVARQTHYPRAATAQQPPSQPPQQPSQTLPTYTSPSISHPQPPHPPAQSTFQSPGPSSTSGIPPQQQQQHQAFPDTLHHAPSSFDLDPALSSSASLHFDQPQPPPAADEPTALPFPMELYGQTGYADGAADDLPGTSMDVRTAFRSVDWADLSLTPAVGSDASNSSTEEWMRTRPR